MQAIQPTDRNARAGLSALSMSMGILMILLGLTVIGFSVAATFITVVTLGIVLAIRGLFEGVYALFSMDREWFWRRLLGGILSLVIGVLILSRPGLTIAALTLFIAAFLIADGLFKAIAAPISHQARWGWEMASGILAVIIGVWVWSGWPTNALWLIGLLIGVEILSQGIAMMAFPFVMGKPSGGGTAAFAR